MTSISIELNPNHISLPAEVDRIFMANSGIGFSASIDFNVKGVAAMELARLSPGQKVRLFIVPEEEND